MDRERPRDIVAQISRMTIRCSSEEAKIDALDTLNRLIEECRLMLGMKAHQRGDDDR